MGSLWLNKTASKRPKHTPSFLATHKWYKIVINQDIISIIEPVKIKQLLQEN